MPNEEHCQNPTIQSSLNVSSKDKFVLALNMPVGLRRLRANDSLIDMESLQMKVHGAVVPSISVPSIDVPWGGQHNNVSSFARPVYSPLTLSFIVDNSYNNYYVLWKWLALLNSPRESYYEGRSRDELTAQDILEMGMNTEYQTTFSILALNEYSNVTMEFVYYNAFITNLGGITYSYRDGEVIESTAEFQYNQFDIKKPKTPTPVA